jgi:menaquinone-dependent protoporphyrinogen oxidase
MAIKNGVESDYVLVVYATSYGSTQEVAEAIAASLLENGSKVDIMPAREVKSLDKYTAVVVGSGLYMSKWHKDARGFLSRHREALSERPVAIFSLGPVQNVDKEWEDARFQLDQEIAKFPWLKPVAHEILGGVLDPTKLRFPASLFAKSIPAGDVRDWSKIRAWANDLPAKFHAPK